MTQTSEPIRVVVVDDHPVVRDGLVGMFTTEPGVEVVGQAGDGREALVVIDATSPDVVLMDLRMSGGDGIEAISALRADGRTTPRILVLTTYNAERDIRTALEAGADGYLLKDARRAELVRAVTDLAQGRPVLTAEALAVLAGRTGEQQLTDRELDALRLIAEGFTNRSAAARMHVSEATIKTHLAHAFDKLGVSDRAAAVRVAYERGIL
ncbi:response regulator transcription factor [Tessaracoccus sp. OS52]|uniref:response regulator n=1 Tax=Tessaracoccus sp. OS52 TaxID=2886691 RepID=UPI001D1192CD|nr:response regulator transcription factor [Tessaracoccus sp. OS52]MCC2593780.1 response regulator transcription factor [Tessaracoccus sp. OS52]